MKKLITLFIVICMLFACAGAGEGGWRIDSNGIYYALTLDEFIMRMLEEGKPVEYNIPVWLTVLSGTINRTSRFFMNVADGIKDTLLPKPSDNELYAKVNGTAHILGCFNMPEGFVNMPMDGVLSTNYWHIARKGDTSGISATVSGVGISAYDMADRLVLIYELEDGYLTKEDLLGREYCCVHMPGIYSEYEDIWYSYCVGYIPAGGQSVLVHVSAKAESEDALPDMSALEDVLCEILPYIEIYK